MDNPLPGNGHGRALGPVLGDEFSCLAGGGDTDDGRGADVVSSMNGTHSTVNQKYIFQRSGADFINPFRLYAKLLCSAPNF